MCKTLTFLILIGITVEKSRAQVHSLSIQDAIALATKNNAAVKNAILNLHLQEQDNKSVTAGALPTVSGSAGTTIFFQTPVTIVPGEFFGYPPGTTLAVSFQPKYVATAGFTLDQTIFDGQVFVGLKARKTALDFYKSQLNTTIESITVNVYKIYYQLVVSRTQMTLIDSNIARADKLLHDTKIMYANGFMEKLDMDKATVQLANLQTLKTTTQTTIDNGYLSLKFLIGLPSADSVVLTSSFREEDLTRSFFLDSGYRYENRPDYQTMQLSRQLDDFDVRRYKALYYPTLSLNGAFQKNAYNNTYDFFSKGGNWYSTSYAGISLHVPIFSGFSKDANLQKARLRREQTDVAMENLRQSIDLEVGQARNTFLNAIHTISYQKENVALAESVYNQTKKKFESGLASNTDLNDSQTSLIEAQTNYVNALYLAVIAKIDYLKAIGKI